MVSSFPMHAYYRSASLTVDTNHAQTAGKRLEDEKHGLLDDNIIDQGGMDSGLELSPPMVDSRRDSFAMGPSLFSPKTEDWQSVEMQSVPSNPFPDQPTNSNPFFRYDQNQGAGAFGPPDPWSTSHQASTSGPDDVAQHFAAAPNECEPRSSVFQTSTHGPMPFATHSNMFASLGAGDQSIPTSPQKEWLGNDASNSKKMRSGSSSIQSFNDLRRGDGIRKKNARFEIPPERNLNTIDQLIAQSTDEQEIKELKQQKRLLRNRQAALDSRQRKKLHTERLEDEKKQYASMFSELEDEMAAMKVRMDQLAIENNKYLHCIDTLTLEKDEMIRAHTVESGELRKKIGILTDHVQHLEMNSVPSSAPGGQHSVPGAYHHMDGMAGSEWDTPTFLSDFDIEPLAECEPQHEMPLTQTKKPESALASAEADKSASQGGLLFMLFLVGAFVMSNRSTPSIPPVSDDVRAASATLLDNVLKDAGVNGPSSTSHAPATQASVMNWAGPIPSMPVHDMSMDNVAPSMLMDLGGSLTQPSQQQINEQVFSLSPGQYNGISDAEYLQNMHQPDRVPASQGRKNLADALASVRAPGKRDGAAEVYTRSLLWDQIPNDVVRDFAKMFAECNSAHNDQQCNESR